MRVASETLEMILQRWWLFLLSMCLATVAQAVTQDITGQFAIARSGLILNRTTNTFDSTVTLRNTSVTPVLGPISAVVSGLPATVTLANKTGDTADGKPYVTPMQAGSQLQGGASISFVLKFANPQRVAFGSTLQILYSFDVPPEAPSLISVVATGGTSAFLIGRVDGAFSRSITLQASAASSCFLGTLVGATAVGTVQTTTDAAGYFGVAVTGVGPGKFVAVKLTSPSASPSSMCQVSARDNDSWPKAFALDGASPTTQDFIDSPGKARWYKFSIVPGQRIQVSLSGLAADYDLAVFKDLGQAFAKQFEPSNANAGDLLKLTAEYAPSVFSPSVFSPSVFSPDAFSPSVFSPSVFSPSVFSPSVFSPSVFSPSVFSPSVFSPSVFSPSVFSPSVFSPSVFSPSVFSPMEVAQAFSTVQTRSIIAVAANPGTASESAVVNTWNSTGSFYVRVTGRSGAFSTSIPFTLAIAKGVTTCTGVTDTLLTSRPAVAASDLRTVILADSSKVPLDEPLLIPGGGTLRAKLASFAARAEVRGVIVDVANDSRVTALKQQAASHPACPFAKNLVAEEVKGIVDSYRANPLRYVVIIGNDDAIPFFRSPDQSNLGQESSFVPPVQSNSPSEASLRRDFVLSQDEYGSKTRLSSASIDFPVPGLAVGRLVETAAEIGGVIDAYVAANGVVVPRSSLVTGYDFLEDAANAVRSELQMGTGAVSDALITPNGKSPQDPASWTAAQLRQKLLGSRHDVIFLAGHFSANSALAADFSTSLLTTDVAASAVDLTNTVVFSAGCHSGFNLVDVDAISGVTMPLDWAQMFARKRATLIAGTGYQYGDTDFLEYSERLYRNFARHLRAGTGAVAIGEALVKAKLDYLMTTPDIRGIHEKALLEATLFGLPMLGVNMPAGRGSAPGNVGVITPAGVSAGPAASLGLKTHDLNLAPTLTPQTLSLKNVLGGPNVVVSWLNGPEGVVSKSGEPALPLAAVNVTPTDAALVLRGIGFRGGTYVDSAPLIPFSGAPATELRGVHVPFLSPTFFPARMWSLNYFGALSGSGGTQLLLTPAQHRVANVAAGTSTQRKFAGLDLRLFYSANLSKAALSDAPSIVAIEEEKAGGDVTFAVQVVGDPAAAVHQVWVTYTSDVATSWASIDLAQCVVPLPAVCGTTSDSRLWKGRLANAPASLKYMVQAVSGVGLVALDDNRGAYHGVGAVTPAATTVQLVTPPTGAAIGDNVDIKARLLFAGSAVAGKMVLVTLGGVSKIGVTGSDGAATVKLPIAAAPGNYSLVASFAGDDSYLPSSSPTGSFQITKATSQLAGLAPTGVTLTGVLGGKTQALQQEAVAFAVDGPGGPRTIWANTNNLGRATLPPPGLPAGNYVVASASFGGNPTFAAANITFATAQQFTVAPLAQTIAFAPLANAPYGVQEFGVFPTASSALPVSLAASGVCSVADNLVLVTGIGTCTITATQVGDPLYGAAAPQVRSFVVSKANQVITFAPAPSGVTVGQPLVKIGASSSSPSAAPSTIPIVYGALTPAICTLGGPTGTFVTTLAAGTCTIAANQAGDAIYNAAPQATLSFAVGAAGALPATFTVTNLNNGGAGSLRDAIAQANAAPGPNIVDFAPGLTGTIVLTSGQIQIAGPLAILGPGSGSLTIDGNANNRIFSISATFSACPAGDPADYLVMISGLRLTNGARIATDSVGGAIYSEHSLVLDDVTIDNSIARSGGGLFFGIQFPGQSLSITNSRFLDNTSRDFQPTLAENSAGAGVYVVERCQNALDTPYTEPAPVLIANSEFRGNSSQPINVNGRGGAIRSWSRADIVIADTMIVDNHVDAPNPPLAGQVFRGGGYEGLSKSLRIERTEISDNSANDVTLSDATRSGGLHLQNPAIDRQSPADTMSVKILNSTISGNLSSATGGAMVANGNIALEISNTTVSSNLAAPTRNGGVIMSMGDTYPVSGNLTARPTLKLISTIIANNTSAGSDLGYNTTLMATFTVNAINSLIERPCTSCQLFVTGTSNLIGVDPLLGPLAPNGGPTRTHALLPGSPVINAGANPFGLVTDQRGVGFPRVLGAAADMGAYESP